MIKSVKFKNFKSLENFTVSLDQRNILVGPNNAGKSTILDAFRALYGAVRYARTKRPQRIRAANGSYLQGYEIPEGSIVISPENIQTNYDDIETEIRFKLDNGNSLILEFSQHHVPHLLLEQNSGQTNTTRDFQRNFPVDIVVIPTLGPFEDEEELLTQEYIMANVSTRRSHRLFRNIWHYKNEREFKSFSDLLVQTWPEIEIKKPERRGYLDRHIDMFCSENRIDREVHWAGFGFQIWLKILTHILEAEETSTLIIDEVEIYLHPELQRKLFQFLCGRGQQIIMASHSVEIINEADPEDILVVDRQKSSARRVNDVEALQAALNYVGSKHNIRLSHPCLSA